MNTNLETIKRARQMGVATLVLMLVALVPTIATFWLPESVALEAGIAILFLVMTVTYTLFLVGIVALGKEVSHARLVQNARHLLIIGLIIGVASSFNSPVLIPLSWSMTIVLGSLVLLIAVGVLSIRFGKDLRDLEPTLGRTAVDAAKWNTISGYLMASFILSPIGVLLSLIADYYLWRTLGEYLRKGTETAA